MRLAIDINQQRILFVRLKPFRLQHPGVQFDPFADIKLHELGRLTSQPFHPVTNRGVVVQQFHNAMAFDFDELMDGRGVQCRKAMHRELGVWRKGITMRPDLGFRRDSGQLARTIQRYPVKVFLRPVLWRRIEIIPPTRLVDHSAVNDVVIPRREKRQFLAITRISIGMPPPILLADDDKFFAPLIQTSPEFFPDSTRPTPRPIR